MSVQGEYVKRMTDALMQMHPDWDKDEVERRIASR